MKDIIPGLGKKTARERLDELFSRETLGAVLFGAAVSKIVEKVNVIVASLFILYSTDIDIGVSVWVLAGVLLLWWSIELVLFIYLYIRWERAMEAISDAADSVSESASKAKDKVNDDG